MAVELIFGSKEMGKTSYMLSQIKSSIRPCVAIDTIKDTDPNTHKLRFDELMIRYEEIPEEITFDKFKIVYTPKDQLDMNIFCHHLYYYYGINIFIDELDQWTHSKFLPFEIYNLFRYSRHRDFNIFCTMRNPYETHRNIRASADYFVIYKLQEKGHLEYFEYYQEGITAKIKGLAKHSYIKIPAW